jgi:hypothetical protein
MRYITCIKQACNTRGHWSADRKEERSGVEKRARAYVERLPVAVRSPPAAFKGLKGLSVYATRFDCCHNNSGESLVDIEAI